MKIFTRLLFLFLFCMSTIQNIQAQVVTQAWATLASNIHPVAIAIDGSGNVYTTNDNSTVGKITPDGTFTQAWATLAIDATPHGIAIDGSGNVYTTNIGNNTVSKITPDGTVTQAWATLASDAYPVAIAIDGSGNVYTANYNNNTVSKITPDGTVTQAWATLASNARPEGIAIDGSGNVYTANYNNNKVSKITAGGTVTEAWATFASSSGIKSIAIDGSGNVYTANAAKSTVGKITAGGTVTQAWATLASGTYPQAIAIDGSGNVYTANNLISTISKITAGGTVTQAWATLASNARPQAIAIDGSGNVYTANNYNSTVSKISVLNTWTGATSTAWGTTTNWSSGSVPVSTDNVVIPSTSNQPTISAAGAAAHTITIQSGAILTVTSPGTLTASNGITVNTGAALVGSAATITGTVTLQQSIIGQRGWRIFANPFSTAQDLSTVASTNNITIHTTGSSNAAGIADDRIWDNSSNAWSDGGSSIGSNIPYGLFIRGLSSEVNGSSYTGGPSAFTYNVSGTLNGNTTSITPNNASHFMVVGNPYAAPVTTQALTGQSSTPYYTYQIAVTGTPQVRAGSWVAASGNSAATSTIPVLGCVAYQPSNTTSFSVGTADINTGGTLQSGIFGAIQPITQLELMVEQDGYYQDKLFVRLDATATENGTDHNDLKKFYNDVTNLYTITPDATRLAIDARQALSIVPLGISAPAGTYNFKLNNNTLPEGTTVSLRDNLKQTETQINAGDTYQFSISADTSSMGEHRFELVFNSKQAIITTADNSGTLKARVLGNITQNGEVGLEISAAAGPVVVAIKDMEGRTVGVVNAVNGTQYIGIGNTVAGMLLLQISDGKSSVIQKVIKL